MRDSAPAAPKAHAGWRSRGYLPHFDSPETVQHIVFRLTDAISPSAAIDLARMTPADRLSATRALLREGHGARWLADPRCADIVQRALLHFDGERYRILAWCVMPTHVHVLFEQEIGHSLAAIVQSWKSFSGREANKLIGSRDAFWAPDYFDRFMRDEGHLAATRSYIENNPVKAGLCATPEEWEFSSAWAGRRAPRAREL